MHYSNMTNNCPSQSKMKTAHESIVEPLLNVLRSLHLEVQDEGKMEIMVVKNAEVALINCQQYLTRVYLSGSYQPHPAPEVF